ncbi:MAG: aminotransferase class I/II-fold pyridoxal phosphate-dependent enzyme, partial [Spongiibacteraceae bacterium]|nr:aminotransferase class I/II-fold pyridoxal phosphate-dependent enzyme [Spongiibacteraceae bacterium]
MASHYPIDTAKTEQLQQWEAEFAAQYQRFRDAGLNLDLTRGKPNSAQLALSDRLDGILAGDFRAADGTDTRNYGGLDGLQEAKALFAPVLGVAEDEILVGGNSSLTLMYQAVQFSLLHGIPERRAAWQQDGERVKFLCPVPGYDRHFSICEQLGIEMIPVPMNEHGPDMDMVEQRVADDPAIKGIWCVPRFSNPTGIVYSDAVIKRLAELPDQAGPHFRVFCDNAYAVHTLNDDAPPLCNVMDAFKAAGNADALLLFGSTSKITHAGAGVAFMGATPAVLKGFLRLLGVEQIGPDKVNQLRHVRLLKSPDGIHAHMRGHAALLQPRFDIVLRHLNSGLKDGYGHWTEPQGGYFVSFDTRPGLARTVVRLAADAGVKLTPAGATFPYGKDPQDRNIRIAPSVPSL